MKLLYNYYLDILLYIISKKCNNKYHYYIFTIDALDSNLFSFTIKNSIFLMNKSK